MPRIWKHIINITFGAALIALLTFAYFWGKKDRGPIICKGLSITITDSTMNQFITPGEIQKILDSEYKDYIGIQVDSIDLSRVERILEEKSAVLTSEAFVTKDSLLNVIVTQRKPLVRFQKGNKGFYADAQGYLFPLQNSYTSHVHIVDGEIPLKIKHGYMGRPENESDRKWLKDMIRFVQYIHQSKVWKENIVQITVDKTGDLILTPREGDEKFIFGQPYDLEKKFKKMEIYYTGICKDKGIGYYKWVDLRYEDQIICRQNKEK